MKHDELAQQRQRPGLWLVVGGEMGREGAMLLQPAVRATYISQLRPALYTVYVNVGLLPSDYSVVGRWTVPRCCSNPASASSARPREQPRQVRRSILPLLHSENLPPSTPFYPFGRAVRHGHGATRTRYDGAQGGARGRRRPSHQTTG